MVSRALIGRSGLVWTLIRLAAGAAVVLVGGITHGCGKPFNVKERPDLPPAKYAAREVADGVDAQAQVITDEDFLYDTFDANLISAGVLPVRVMLTNSSGRTVDLRKARFEINWQRGRGFKAVDARGAFRRLVGYYEISLYNKAGYKESLDAFSQYAIDVKTPLDAGQSRHGLMFFLVPSDIARQSGLTLEIGRLGFENKTPIVLKLN